MTNMTIDAIKGIVEENVGNRVELKVNRGRNRVETNVGIIVKAYSSLFTVALDAGEPTERKISCSYADVLTETVVVSLDDSEKNILS